MDQTQKEKQQTQNLIKLGMFQLQTKSFWLSLISILALFLAAIIWMNTYYYQKIINSIIQNNRQLIKIVNVSADKKI